MFLPCLCGGLHEWASCPQPRSVCGRNSAMPSISGSLCTVAPELHCDWGTVIRSISTSSFTNSLFFNIMAALAVMERELILERTRAGLEAARKAGRVGGRPRLMTPGKVSAARTLLAAGTPPRDVASTVGVSLATLYRHLRSIDGASDHQMKRMHGGTA